MPPPRISSRPRTYVLIRFRSVRGRLRGRAYPRDRLRLFLPVRGAHNVQIDSGRWRSAVADEVLGGIVATARVIGALVLLFFLPGFFLINALYPRKGELDREYDGLYRLTLGIVLSIAVTVFWSFFLNSLGVNEATGLGYVVTPNIAGGLIGLTLAFFALGWWRGAYPWMARFHPSLARVPKPGPGELLTEEERDHRIRLQLKELAEKRESLRRAIKDAERRMQMQSAGARSHYEEVRDRSRNELKAVEAKLRALEEERAAELY